MKIPNKLYDVLKWVCMIFIPALSTLLSVILSVWMILPPETITAITTTLSAVAAFVGAMIGISTSTYNREIRAAEAKRNDT